MRATAIRLLVVIALASSALGYAWVEANGWPFLPTYCLDPRKFR